MKIYTSKYSKHPLDRYVGKDVWIAVRPYYTEREQFEWYQIISKRTRQGKECYGYYTLFSDDYYRMIHNNWDLQQRKDMLRTVTSHPFYDPIKDCESWINPELVNDYLTTEELFRLNEAD